MSDWLRLFRKPTHWSAPDALDDWFTRIAERLLNGSRLTVGKQAYRLVEIEFYYWSDAHPDPFAHRDPIQFSIGHWYFHRTRGTLRSGSFKGLDLTFGDGPTSGGILIRGMETPSWDADRRPLAVRRSLAGRDRRGDRSHPGTSR